MVVNTSSNSSGPIILAPGTKIQEQTAASAAAKNDASDGNYDFYDILQAKKASNKSIKPASKPVVTNASAPKVATKYFIQAGAFGDDELAGDMKGRLALLGIDSSIKSQQQGSSKVNRVLIGPLATEENAQKIINQLSDQQINAVLIRVTK